MISDLIRNKNLLLVCGSGGVGKTTTAAAIALKAATMGKKTIVLTIDPAKRLATSLGLESLSSKPKKIDPKLIEIHAGEVDGELWAMMLDTKSTFDQLVIKYSPNKETEKKILKNKIYQHVSSMLAGSQEYMAMEKLYEFVTENKYDLVVIDTPPTTHAIDFLQAPQKMIDALSHSMIHLLLKPAMMMGKGGLKLFERGSQVLLKVFDRVTGFAILQDISELLITFKELLGGFQGRADEVRKIVKQDTSAFLLVTACERKSVEEARYFAEKLKEFGTPLEEVILNRVHPYYRLSRKEEAAVAIAEQVGETTANKMIASLEKYQTRARRDMQFKKEIEGFLNDEQKITAVPLFKADIHDIGGLLGVAEYFK